MADETIYNKPSTPRQEYVEAAKDITLIRDLLAGTRRMHEQFKEYIPKYSSEKPLAYKRRATAAKVYGGLTRTLSAAVGMLFARPPEQSDTWSAEIEGHWENIDGKGTHGDVFVKRRARDGIADGLGAILVDFTPAPAGVVVHGGNEVELGLRPLWAAYMRADIVSWRTQKIENVETLTQVVLRDGATTDVGEYGSTPVTRYRICRLGTAPDPARPEAGPVLMASWRLVEEKTGADGKVSVSEIEHGVFRAKSGAAFPRIPLAIIYAGHSDQLLCAEPPLLPVAWANLEHWRVATNLRYYEDLCCFPQPTVEGELAKGPNGEDLPFVLGPGIKLGLTAGSKFTWTEVSGESLQQLRASLEEKRDEIGELGVSFLAKKSRGVETAEAKRLDATAENATLATSAQGIQDGINQALQFHAQYLGIAPQQAPTLTINTNFDLTAMDPATMLAYVTAVKDAGLPVRTLLEAWQLGGRLPLDTDLEALEAEMMANAAAAEAQRQLEAQLNKPPVGV